MKNFIAKIIITTILLIYAESVNASWLDDFCIVFEKNNSKQTECSTYDGELIDNIKLMMVKLDNQVYTIRGTSDGFYSTVGLNNDPIVGKGGFWLKVIDDINLGCYGNDKFYICATWGI